MIVIITKQHHRPHQHCISLTHIHPLILDEKEEFLLEENEFKANAIRVCKRECLMAPSSNPKKFANDTED